MIKNTAAALTIALFFSSALCASVTVVLTPAGYRGGNNYSALLNAAENFFSLPFILALVLLVLIGPIWFLIYRSHHLSGLGWHVALGGGIGAAVGALAEGMLSADDHDYWQTHDQTLPLLQMGGYGAIFGVVGGLIFWLIRRPDRDTTHVVKLDEARDTREMRSRDATQ